MVADKGNGTVEKEICINRVARFRATLKPLIPFQREAKMIPMIDDLICYAPAAAMIENYQLAQENIQQAFELLQKAKSRLSATFGGNYDRVLPHHLNEYDLDQAAKDSTDIIRRNSWKAIIAKTEFKGLLSKTRCVELEKQLNNEKLPELDTVTLADMFADFRANIDDHFEDLMKEVFKRLRPCNSKAKIGKKVILCGLISYYSIWTTDDGEKDIRSIENVFRLIEGKGLAKYPNDAVTLIQGAMRKKEFVCETEYFTMKWFKNRNAHFIFKRLDLLKELNKIGGKKILSD